MNGDHIFGPAPRLFSLDVVEPEASGPDEVSVRAHRIARTTVRWGKGRASRFAERASFANACRADRERVRAMLVEAVARRAAQKRNAGG